MQGWGACCGEIGMRKMLVRGGAMSWLVGGWFKKDQQLRAVSLPSLTDAADQEQRAMALLLLSGALLGLLCGSAPWGCFWGEISPCALREYHI